MSKHLTIYLKVCILLCINYIPNKTVKKIRKDILSQSLHLKHAVSAPAPTSGRHLSAPGPSPEEPTFTMQPGTGDAASPGLCRARLALQPSHSSESSPDVRPCPAPLFPTEACSSWPLQRSGARLSHTPRPQDQRSHNLWTAGRDKRWEQPQLYARNSGGTPEMLGSERGERRAVQAEPGPGQRLPAPVSHGETPAQKLYATLNLP